jgi:hypothetical protein
MQVRVTGFTSTFPGFTADNVLPITAKLYYDKDPSKTTDDVFIEEMQIPGFSETYQQFNKIFTKADLDANGEFLVVTYTASASCLTKRSAETSLAPLPVKFTSFTAVRKDESKVNLTWSTSMEENNRGFYVQRNLGNGVWKDVAFVFSESAEGNSSVNLNYSYTDINPHKGVSQYRILQVDLDGTGRYSVIRSVGGKGVAGKMLLFPNPSSNGAATLLFDTDGTRDVMVSDVSGRVVQQFRQVRGNSLSLKNLSTGYYTVQVRDVATGVTATERLIVNKL